MISLTWCSVMPFRWAGPCPQTHCTLCWWWRPGPWPRAGWWPTSPAPMSVPGSPSWTTPSTPSIQVRGQRCRQCLFNTPWQRRMIQWSWSWCLSRVLRSVSRITASGGGGWGWVCKLWRRRWTSDSWRQTSGERQDQHNMDRVVWYEKEG